MKKHSSASLKTLLRTQQLWCANSVAPATQGIDTGFGALNAALHNGGWPHSGAVELLGQHTGIGELQLLLPLLQYQQQQGRYVLFSNTPYTLYAPALAQAKIKVSQLLLLKPQAKTPLLWALEQSLRSGCCGAVVSWLVQLNLRSSELRRLQLAAQQGNSLLFLYRSLEYKRQASPAKLRLALYSKHLQLHLHILKQPGGWAGQSLNIGQPQHAQYYLTPTLLPTLSSRLVYRHKAATTAASANLVHPTSQLNA